MITPYEVPPTTTVNSEIYMPDGVRIRVEAEMPPDHLAPSQRAGVASKAGVLASDLAVFIEHAKQDLEASR